MSATAKDFFAAAELTAHRVEPVTVPGVGTLYARGLTVGEWGEYQKAGLKTDAKGKVTFEPDAAKLVQLAACDEAGRAVFGPADLPRLRAAPAALVLPLAAAARKLSAGEDEGDEGNSPATPASGAS